MTQGKEETLIAYKGFDANMQCRGFQYEIGKTYKHDGKVSLCSSGFHACEAPFDVWNYYKLTNASKFAQVELGGVSDKTDGDTKRCGSSITIKFALTLPMLIKAQVEWTVKRADKNVATGNSGHAAATGEYGHAAATGYYGCAFVGFHGKAKAGENGSFAIAFYDENKNRARLIVGTPGEDGIKADVFYRVNDAGKLVEAK